MNDNTNNTNKKYQIVYSLRVRIALRERGFEPIVEEDNYRKPGFKCWHYLNTPEFSRALTEIMEE